jgi:hypothetical protein
MGLLAWRKGRRSKVCDGADRLMVTVRIGLTIVIVQCIEGRSA